LLSKGVTSSSVTIFVLLGVNVAIFFIVMLFWNSQVAIINTIFKIAGYTSGSILGLYITALFLK